MFRPESRRMSVTRFRVPIRGHQCWRYCCWGVDGNGSADVIVVVILSKFDGVHGHKSLSFEVFSMFSEVEGVLAIMVGVEFKDGIIDVHHVRVIYSDDGHGFLRHGGQRAGFSVFSF